MRRIAFGALALGVVVALPGIAASDGNGDAHGKNCTDDAAVAAARAAADEQCDCDRAKNHGQYVKCVGEVAKTLAGSGALPEQCKGTVTSCAARSTCGKPGAVTCCRVDRRGKVKCQTKSSAAKCKAPNGGQACTGSAASCCDSCGAGSAGGSFVCQGTTTTTTAAPTTTTQPPAT